MVILELNEQEAKDLRDGLTGWIDIPDFRNEDGTLKGDAPEEIKNLHSIIQRLVKMVGIE